MSADDNAKRLKTLLKRLHKAFPAAGTDAKALGASADDPIDTLLWSYLLWENNSDSKAENAMRRLRTETADTNELRICLPDELEEFLGERYPRCSERVARMRATLHNIFKNEQAVTLEHLTKLGKRDARKYLDALDGIPQYVAARTTLVGLGGHAVPLDDQLRTLLIEEGVLDAEDSLEKSASTLERMVKAADGAEAHRLFEAWAEGSEKTGSKKAAAPRKTSSKKKTASTKKPADSSASKAS